MIPVDGIHGDRFKEVVLADTNGVIQYLMVMESGSCHEINLGNGLGHIDNFTILEIEI